MAQSKMPFIGEEPKSPYGGAFKVARKLYDLFPKQRSQVLVRGFSISHAKNYAVATVISIKR